MGVLELADLEINTKYYAKGYVLTATSSHYSQVQEFTTKDLIVSLTVSSVSKTKASLKVEVDENISAINGAGVCYSKNPNPTVSDTKVSGMGALELKNLEINTKYYAKGYALTATSSHYSQVQEFTTEDLIISLAISNVDKRGATATFQADASLPGVLESGIFYSKINEVPTEADKKASGSNSVKLDLLSYETKYFVRAYIKTASKTYYSPVQNFTTIKLPTVKDYDGNVYRIIEMPSTAGLTYWLLDNFKGTHFANGDPIPNVTDNTAWTQQTGPAYCHYDNDPKNTETYGALYNWYVASDPRGLITGWQAPTDKQWLEVSDYAGGLTAHTGHKFKEEGFSHWKSPNTEANNESGFTALPGGIRDNDDGKFYSLKEYTYFITYDNFGIACWARKLSFDNNHFNEPGISLTKGVSVRLRKK